MPLLFQKYHEEIDTTVAVWENAESESELIDLLQLDQAQQKRLEGLQAFRKKEWLCSRTLLDTILPHSNYRIFKDGFGKPFVENSPYFISLSHSQNRAAVIVSKKLVGIDIQREEAKIEKLHTKFISAEEIQQLDNRELFQSYHIFWGAKEAMYKAYGKKQLDFRKHMHIYAFKCFKSSLELTGFVHKNDVHQDYNIFTEILEDYHLCYCIRD